MTQPTNQYPTENQTEKIIYSLKYEIESLKFQLKKKDDQILTLNNMLK
jgi:hypothetical protein